MVSDRKATLSLLVLPIALVACYFGSSGVPELRLPVRVVNSTFVADGGSFRVEVQDQVGRRFAVFASGSLDKPRHEFPIYTQRWVPYLPLPYFVARGSSTEAELAHALAIWSSADSLVPEDRIVLTSVATLLAERRNVRREQ